MFYLNMVDYLMFSLLLSTLSMAHFPTELKQCRKFLQRSDICGDVCLTLLPNLNYQGLQSSWTDFKDLLLSTVSLYDVLLPVTRKNTPDPLPVRRKLSNLKLKITVMWGHIYPEPMRCPECENIGLNLWPIQKTSFWFCRHVLH